jgi:AcrR family transcriptional regulator
MTALPNRDRRAERREATRREILDAGWEIARSEGIAALTLRAVAERIGMRSPSLYSHFESKNAIYDGMFGQAWEQLLALQQATPLPRSPRRRLLVIAQRFFDFSVADLARYQLMNQRTIPDFEPSDEAYAPSVAVMAHFRQDLAEIGITAQADVDLNTAIVAGFVDQQLANDPGGERWRRQLPRLIDMYADAVGVPGPRLRRTG